MLDNKDFYPTPRELFNKLIVFGTQLRGRVLEPSAGKGDMIEHLRQRVGSRVELQIDAIENDQRLINELAAKGINPVWDDFLTYETYKDYDYIVMNPPFSSGVDHVLKALQLAEDQLSNCEVYAILNKQTIANAYSTKRQELLRKLNDYDAEIQYVKDAFIDAERKTEVEVALIHVEIKKLGKGKSIYESIPFFAKSNEVNKAKAELGAILSTHVKSANLHERLNDIERLIAEYETACQLARETYRAIKAKESFFAYVSVANRRVGQSAAPLRHITPHNKEFSASDLREEIDRLRSGYWELILQTDEVRKMLTHDAIQKLNRQIETASDMEINFVNVRTLLMALGANQRDILIDSIVSIFQKITDRHMASYSTNVHYYNGWKTNSSYKINKKIIISVQYSPFDDWDFKEDYDRIPYGVRNWTDDIVKAFQLIDPGVSGVFNVIAAGEFENELFRFKMFKNGNIHIWFKDLPLLSKLNYLCGVHFGWLPSEGEQKRDEKARKMVAREFGDVGVVQLLKEAQ